MSQGKEPREKLGLGERLVALRKRLNLRQVDVAAAVGVSRRTIIRIEDDHIARYSTRVRLRLWLDDQEAALPAAEPVAEVDGLSDARVAAEAAEGNRAETAAGESRRREPPPEDSSPGRPPWMAPRGAPALARLALRERAARERCDAMAARKAKRRKTRRRRRGDGEA